MKKYILSLALSLCTSALWAQPDPPVDPTPLPDIGLLLVAATVYSAREIYEGNI